MLLRLYAGYMTESIITKATIIEDIKILESSLKSILEATEQDRTDHTLVLRTIRGETRFYLRDRNGKTSYLGASRRNEISRYAQKRYAEEVCKAARREIEQLKRCLLVLENNGRLTDINEVFDGLPEGLKPYVVPDSLSDEAYARDWQEGNVVVKHKRLHSKDDYHKYKTIRGDYVGSKSEAIIADRLLANGIPYHYEVTFIPEVEVDESLPVFDETGRFVGYEAPFFDPRGRDVLHPDFYVLNKRTRKSYFWEHLGSLDNAEYCKTNLNRLMRYTDNGYMVGMDVLITHEDSRNPLRLERIDEIIENYLK